MGLLDILKIGSIGKKIFGLGKAAKVGAKMASTIGKVGSKISSSKDGISKLASIAGHVANVVDVAKPFIGSKATQHLENAQKVATQHIEKAQNVATSYVDKAQNVATHYGNQVQHTYNEGMNHIASTRNALQRPLTQTSLDVHHTFNELAPTSTMLRSIKRVAPTHQIMNSARGMMRVDPRFSQQISHATSMAQLPTQYSRQRVKKHRYDDMGNVV